MKSLAVDRLENNLKKRKKKIGILGGTFDPPHKGHLKISLEARKKYNLTKVIWAVTKKSPFKNKTLDDLQKRIELSKKMCLGKSFISIRYYEQKIKSNRSIDLINYLKKKFVGYEFFFLMGADNLVNFHKWYKWREISSKCNILVFDRYGYKSKSKRSISFKKLVNKNLTFINFNKVNISSSKLRKI